MAVETFESRGPATGDLIGTFPRSTARGRRPRCRGRQGGATRTGASSRRRAAARSSSASPSSSASEGRARPTLMTREMGKVLGGGRGRRPGGDRHGVLHGRRRAAPVGPDDAVGAPEQVQHVRAPADRRRRRDHAVELPDRDPGVEAHARARLRQHGRAEAGRGHARARRPLRRAARRGRRARRASSTSSTAAARTRATRSSATRTFR